MATKICSIASELLWPNAILVTTRFRVTEWHDFQSPYTLPRVAQFRLWPILTLCWHRLTQFQCDVGQCQLPNTNVASWSAPGCYDYPMYEWICILLMHSCMRMFHCLLMHFHFYFIMLLFSTNTHIGVFEMVGRCVNLTYLIFTSFFWSIVLVACVHLGCRVVNTRRGLEVKV
jgi:hypothetical protein